MRPVIYLAFANDPINYLSHLPEEERNIREILKERYAKKDHFLVESNSFAQIEDLRKDFTLLQEQIFLFQFSGHASGESLALGSGDAQATGLAKMLAELPQLKLVILNGCETEQQVNLMLDLGIPVVIATHTKISDDLARQFSEQFYESLVLGNSIGDSYQKWANYLEAANLGPQALENPRHRLGSFKQEKTNHWGIFYKEDKRIFLEECLPGTQLPEGLEEQDIQDRLWVQSLEQALENEGVMLRGGSSEIIQHYGWLIVANLYRMLTENGKKGDLSSLAYMTEAWFSSLRYLASIYLAQIINPNEEDDPPTEEQIQIVKSFFRMQAENGSQHTAELHFDYLDLLQQLAAAIDNPFVEELEDFMEELVETGSDLNVTALFLAAQRKRLLQVDIEEAEMASLIPRYLSGLIYWLRRLAFLANYRMASIKDISLSYRLGTQKKFVHIYGELNGMYDRSERQQGSRGKRRSKNLGEEYAKIKVRNFTYNQSVLLFKGDNVASSLKQIDDPSSYLSLSPLIIDHSVFMEDDKQTPEIYYFYGQSAKGRCFHYANYKNILRLQDKQGRSTNKFKEVRLQNDQEPKLNELYEQLKNVLKPFKINKP